MDLKNKKLLMLGGASYAPYIREYSNLMGFELYSIGSSFNQYMNDYSHHFYYIDASDKKSVIEFIREKDIDGIVSLGNESLIDVAIDIASETNLRFYVSRDNWSCLQDKHNFKRHCKEYDISVVEEISFTDKDLSELVTIEYPIVLKPTDGSGSNGVSICYTKEEVNAAVEKAIASSRTRSFIVEKYIRKPEFIVTYMIIDGEPIIWMLGDRYMNTSQDGLGGISNISVYPSKYAELYINNIDEKMKQLIKKYGPKNGTFFAQGFVDDNDILFFDPALRFCGTLDIIPYKKIIGISPLNWMINYSLTGVMDDNNEHKLMDFKLSGKKVIQVSILLHLGCIKNYDGLNEIERLQGVISVVRLLDVGDIVNNPGTLQQVFARIYLVIEQSESESVYIESVYNLISVKDTDNREMVLPPVKIGSMIDERIRDL